MPSYSLFKVTFFMFRFLFISVFFVSLIACSTKTKETEPVVTVSILPQKFFVNQIAGNWLNVNVMVPTGSSPATYEPTPKQMQSVSNSKLYFAIGHIGFEKAWMNKFKSINPKMKVVDTSKDLALIEEKDLHSDCDHDHNHSHSHDGYNPHIWLSPQLVKTQAQSIFKTLANEYPEKEILMKSNLDAFLQKIDSTINSLSKSLADLEDRTFIVYHPVWSYIAKDYNLNEISIEFNGKEASPKKLKQIIDIAKEKNIRMIFVQKEFDASQAESIANEINGKVILLNPLDYNWFEIMHEFSDAFINQ